MLFLRPHVVVVVGGGGVVDALAVVLVIVLVVVCSSCCYCYCSFLLSVSQGSEKVRAMCKFFEDANVCKSIVGLNMFAR